MSTATDSEAGDFGFLASFAGQVTLTRADGNRLGLNPIAYTPPVNFTSLAGPALGAAGAFLGKEIHASEGELTPDDAAMENGYVYDAPRPVHSTGSRPRATTP